MPDEPRAPRRFSWPFLIALVAAIAALAVSALLVTIVQRQQEAENPFYRVVELTDETVDAAWEAATAPIRVSAGGTVSQVALLCVSGSPGMLRR